MNRASCLALGFGVLLALAAGVSCGDGGRPVRTIASLHPSATALPFGPTPMLINEASALWDWIAANSLECEPILRPSYLPSALSQVRLHYVDQQRGCVLFGIEYSNSAGTATLVVGRGPWYNLPLPQSDTVDEEVEVRGNGATYELYHAAEPLGLAFLTWHEPGRWGRPGDSWHRDYVEYLISAEGFSKEELLKVANGLELVTQ